MKEKNILVEILKKLLAEQVSVYKRTNIVKSQKFSEILQRLVNKYINGQITNQEVIDEMLKLAEEISQANKDGENTGLTSEELAFYDALTKPQAVRDFYENDQLIAITKELAETLRNNSTVDWQKREQARAKMRVMIRRLLSKYKYPPDEIPEALQTVMTQCELWADNIMDVRQQDVPYGEEEGPYITIAEVVENKVEQDIKYPDIDEEIRNIAEDEDNCYKG